MLTYSLTPTRARESLARSPTLTITPTPALSRTDGRLGREPLRDLLAHDLLTYLPTYLLTTYSLTYDWAECLCAKLSEKLELSGWWATGAADETLQLGSQFTLGVLLAHDR